MGDGVLELFEVASARVRVAVDGEAALAAQKLINRKTRPLAFNIPERHIDAAQGIVEHRPVPPIRTRIGGLPKVFDIVRVPAAT